MKWIRVPWKHTEGLWWHGMVGTYDYSTWRRFARDLASGLGDGTCYYFKNCRRVRKYLKRARIGKESENEWKRKRKNDEHLAVSRA